VYFDCESEEKCGIFDTGKDGNQWRNVSKNTRKRRDGRDHRRANWPMQGFGYNAAV